MLSILHDSCSCATKQKHKSSNDAMVLARYIVGMNATKEEIGKRLELARKNSKLTRKAVTEKIPGLLESTLSEWEKGRNMANIDFVKLLAKLYDVSAGYLLTLEDAPITKLESQVLYLLRQTDQRGQESVYRVAEAESAYAGRREDEAERRDDDPAAQCG